MFQVVIRDQTHICNLSRFSFLALVDQRKRLDNSSYIEFPLCNTIIFALTHLNANRL